MEINQINPLQTSEESEKVGAMISSLDELVRIDTNNVLSVLETMQAITGYSLMKVLDKDVAGVSVIELVGNGMPGIGRIGGYIENIKKGYNGNNNDGHNIGLDYKLLHIANELKAGKQIDEIGLEILPKPMKGQEQEYASYFINLIKRTDNKIYLVSYPKLEAPVYLTYLSLLDIIDNQYNNQYNRVNRIHEGSENRNENILYIDGEGSVSNATDHGPNSLDDLFT